MILLRTSSSSARNSRASLISHISLHFTTFHYISHHFMSFHVISCHFTGRRSPLNPTGFTRNACDDQSPQTGVLEDAARRRQHVSARLTLTRASEMCDLHAIAAPARSVCSPIAARKVPTHRASRRLPSCLQSTQDDAERRRATHPSCRSSSTIMIESGQTRRRWPRGTGSAGHTRCPRGVQERLWRRRRGGCGSGGGVGEVASRRMLARWGALGACASGRAARRPSEVVRGLR